MYSNLNIPIDTLAPLQHLQFERERVMRMAGDNAASQNMNYKNSACTQRGDDGRPTISRPFLGSSVIDNIQTISSSNADPLARNIMVERSDAAVNQPSTSRSNMMKILADLDNVDALQTFMLNPGVITKGSDLFDSIACKDLPSSIRQLTLDWDKKSIRNLLGMIINDLQAEDVSMFNNVCRILKTTTDSYETECSVQQDLSLLLNKYGKNAIYRHLVLFTDCCYKAWHYNNPGQIKNPTDKDVFGGYEMTIYRNIHRIINQLMVPNQELVGLVCDAIYLNDEFSKLGVAIKTNPDALQEPALITDTFASVFPNTMNPLFHSFSLDETESIHSCGFQTFSQRLSGVFCCNIS